MNFFMCSILGYGFGCIQSAFLISKFLLNEDIRKKGNGNAGASNMTLAYGKKFGALVAIIDILKAFIAVFLIKYLFSGGENIYSYIYLGGLFVILGHNYPFYMSFRGGKGTAALIGMMFGINYMIGIAGLWAFIIFALASDYVVIGTFALLLSFLITTIFAGYGCIEILLSVFICLLSIYNHRKNIRDILSGKEKRIRNTLYKKEKDNE